MIEKAFISVPVLLVEKSGGIATLTLNRPDKMNALSRELRTEIATQVDALEADPEIRVLILTGAGKSFCAGLDLKELGATGLGGVSDAVEVRDPVTSLGKFTGPIIGAINGAAITGGFELALACDVLIASTNARFADTHARVGILPGWGLSQKLSRAVGISRAKELSLTGNFLHAEEADDWGLVNRVVPPGDLMATCRQLAEDMLSVVPDCLTGYKELIDAGFAQNFAEAMEIEQNVSRAANEHVSAADVEQRREAVRQRGKDQAAE